MVNAETEGLTMNNPQAIGVGSDKLKCTPILGFRDRKEINGTFYGSVFSQTSSIKPLPFISFLFIKIFDVFTRIKKMITFVHSRYIL